MKIPPLSCSSKQLLPLLGLLLTTMSASHAATSWPFWGGDAGNTRNAPDETLLSTQTVPQLALLWKYTTGGNIPATPTIDGDDLYLTDSGGYVTKLNRLTGTETWKYPLADYTGIARSASRNSPAIGPSVVVVGDQASATVIAIDKASGALVWKVVLDTQPLARITSSPVISGNYVYAGVSSFQEFDLPRLMSFRGSVAAINLTTGAIAWQTYTVPTGYTGGAVWGSSPVPDTTRNLLYIATGDNYTEPAAVSTCVSGAVSTQQQLACVAPDDYFDAVVALDMTTGTVAWAARLQATDAWSAICLLGVSAGCPLNGPDYDFGSGVNTIQTTIDGTPTTLIGAGEKSGKYWALNPDTGDVVWSTQVGPGSSSGGIMWGSATDGKRVYAAEADAGHAEYQLGPDFTRSWSDGSWLALDAATGTILWQIPEAGLGSTIPYERAASSAALSVANGVLYAGSESGEMLAIDAATGRDLWRFQSGGTVIDGPSIVAGIVYWGSGYSGVSGGTANNVLYAFTVPANTASAMRKPAARQP